jgi:hypothetical protein
MKTEKIVDQEKPKRKSVKIVHVDGFDFTQEEWDEIKHSYVGDCPTHYQLEVAEECKSYIVSALNNIDKTLTMEDYSALSSPEWLQQKGYNFINLQLTKEATDNDLVLLEQFLEVICGIKDEDKRELVGQLIDTTIDRINERWKDTYH